MKNTSIHRKLFVCAAAVALGISAVGVKLALAADPPVDSDVSAVMKAAFKGTTAKPAIIKKATTGKATPDELKTLLENVQKLQKATPPLGEKADWDKRTAAIVKATEAVVKAGDAASWKALDTAATCKDCHTLHRKPA